MRISETTTQRCLIIAGLADTDPRTVRAYLNGVAVRVSVRERIENAVRHWDEMKAAYERAQSQGVSVNCVSSS